MKGWRAQQAAKGYENLSCDDQLMFVNRFNKQMTKKDVMGLHSLEIASHLVRTFVCSKSWLDVQKLKSELSASAPGECERSAKAKGSAASEAPPPALAAAPALAPAARAGSPFSSGSSEAEHARRSQAAGAYKLTLTSLLTDAHTSLTDGMVREDEINKQEKKLVVMVAALFKADKVVFTDHRKLDNDDERFKEMVSRFMKGANHSGTTLTARVMHETMRVLSEDPIEVDESDDSEDEGDEGEGLCDHFGIEHMVSTATAHLSKNKQGSGCMAESDQESAQTQQQEYSGAPGTEYTPVQPRRQLLSGERMSEMDNSGARVSFSPPNKEKGNKRKAGVGGEVGGVQSPLSNTQAKKQRKAKEAAERAAAATKKKQKKKQRKEAAARAGAKAPASGN